MSDEDGRWHVARRWNAYLGKDAWSVDIDRDDCCYHGWAATWREAMDIVALERFIDRETAGC